ncbi:hypothetical protein CRV01_01515 [Arcobacter sp. CECT 8983]|uniref:tRNA (5-methylaminomethyl-2-thiouridine)(34)-methyltransferase MnmD n=1 Tax=Arcobacter sp. CECT 8983 TaxID=2044508 RepID=UPI00100A258D|nr:MnmC family methyltransferase [Arcobacter sp. CECT 8983]RXJ91797.1 hypothetical protein CRV01_01515 [Arcobacter sp. CECT 8983]
MLVKTKDNSNTLYSTKYNQHFHDLKTGAIQESLIKHVLPAFNFHKEKRYLKILDICFGLGYNTFSTINYILENNLDKKIEIFSPELDDKLIESLKEFEFPQEFEKISHIIKELLETKKYKDENIQIELFIGNARKYIKTIKDLDIVYQDAFSSEVNRELWTVEYFKDIFNASNNEVIVTTYSIASNVRLSLYKAGFEVFEINPTGKRKQTIAIKSKKDINAKYIDMQLKQERNKELKALYD